MVTVNEINFNPFKNELNGYFYIENKSEVRINNVDAVRRILHDYMVDFKVNTILCINSEINYKLSLYKFLPSEIKHPDYSIIFKSDKNFDVLIYNSMQKDFLVDLISFLNENNVDEDSCIILTTLNVSSYYLSKLICCKSMVDIGLMASEEFSELKSKYKKYVKVKI